MSDFYVDPALGHDGGSGSLSDPWQTIARAVKTPSSSPVIHLVPGIHQTTSVALRNPITIVGLAPGVIIEPLSGHGAWDQVQVGGQLVRHAKTINVPLGKRITQAAWIDANGYRSRIPVWNPLPPIDTPDKWAAAVLGTGNPHTRWGLFSTDTDLYLIAPASWADPNLVKITTGWSHSFQINGPDITLSGLEIAGHAGLRIDVLAARAHLSDLHLLGSGITFFGGVGPSYSHDHLLERLTFEDNGTCIREGDSAPVAGQGISWNLVKQSGVDLGIKDSSGKAVLAQKPLTSSENTAILSYGGSLNTIIQDCSVDGYFDGFDSWDDGRYDASVDTNLIVRRCSFKNITDDALDRSRFQNNVLFEDCTFRNTGTILSPAPLWGNITMRRCFGSLIGEQVRIADGFGHRPSGSLIKYGAIDAGRPQGSVVFEDCVFWTNTPTSQGICPDGGDGPLVPKFSLLRTVMRVPYIVLNWGANYTHPSAWLSIDSQSMLASSGTRPLKVQGNILPTILTSASVVDALYYDPANGDFTLQIGGLEQLRDIVSKLILFEDVVKEYGWGDAEALEQAYRQVGWALGKLQS